MVILLPLSYKDLIHPYCRSGTKCYKQERQNQIQWNEKPMAAAIFTSPPPMNPKHANNRKSANIAMAGSRKSKTSLPATTEATMPNTAIEKFETSGISCTPNRQPRYQLQQLLLEKGVKYTGPFVMCLFHKVYKSHR